MKKIVLGIALMLASFSFASAQKYAYVDTDYILDNIPEYGDAKTTLDELSAKWQKEIEAKFSDIDKLYKSFQTESVLLPEDVKKKKEDDIVKKEKDVKDLQKQRFGKEGDLFKKRQELVKPIQEKIYNAIEQIATDEGYAVIFDKAGSLSMIYTNPKFDISEDILNKLGYTYNARPGKGEKGNDTGTKKNK
ncbi:MAG TPA: OmpH family outer membrane protein [Bacteroidales bacterium]